MTERASLETARASIVKKEEERRLSSFGRHIKKYKEEERRKERRMADRAWLFLCEWGGWIVLAAFWVAMMWCIHEFAKY